MSCDSIILIHSFTLLFAFCKLFKKKRLLKFDQELSACRKKVTVYSMGYQRTGRILLAKLRCICLEAEALKAISVEAEVEAVWKYTASTSLVYSRFLDYLLTRVMTQLIS